MASAGFRFWRSCVVLAAVFFVFPSFKAVLAGEKTSSANCSFTGHQDEFLSAQSRAVSAVHQKALKLERTAAQPVNADSIPRVNFIDEEIFGRLQRTRTMSAALSTDEEFVRRIHLDLTGRLPSHTAVRDFLADTDPGKRGVLIDKLLASPAFNDKWTWWLSDLLQINSAGSTFNRQVGGRNAFYLWAKAKIAERESLKDIAHAAVSGEGSNYLMETGYTNFALYASTPGGPIQDTYDTMLVKTASTFLGVSHYDCLLCHNGRGHLDQLSLWARTTTRFDAERMAAFFSRMQLANHPETNQRDSFYFNSRMIAEARAGQYDLNTTNGNRPPRCAPNAQVIGTRCSATGFLMPEYLGTGATPAASRPWRAAFADNMVYDPMFARNFANRLWKEMFNLGLVDPVDTLDPARLDPRNPPPDPWTLQATHPELLEKLAAAIAADNFDLRKFLKLLVASNAYQLSSRYGGGWKLDYVPLFARHYPRRLEGEEIHDAVLSATGTGVIYTSGDLPPMSWAIQLPEPREPTNNAFNALMFMNAFLRGNRDTVQRSQAGSILQQLNLMNDPFVLERIKTSAAAVLNILANNSDRNAAVEEMFLRFLSRLPTDAERREALAPLARASTQSARYTAIEDLAWALINKTEFIFSY